MFTTKSKNGKAVGAVYPELFEREALEQFRSALDQPYVLAGALMADAHTGYSLPIGGVIMTEGYVVPAWIGFDIGCGMSAVRTTLKRGQVAAHAEAVREKILELVPVGFAKRTREVAKMNYPSGVPTREARKIYEDKKASLQLGTLGGGNHFIEIGYDTDDDVWVIVHSGSRGFGHGVASYYMAAAAGSDRAEEGHHALRAADPLGRAYLMDVEFTQQFALRNRELIILASVHAMEYIVGSEGIAVNGSMINKNHNCVLQDGKKFLHRKGATSAQRGELGVIPGNMRDGSFIVRGKGDGMALWSSSHGAGRVLSRGAAKRELDLEEFKEQMQGITAGVSENTLDEAPGAYKDIFEVMEQQKDLVEVVTHIKPIINVKG